IAAVTPGQVINVTIGAGGAGGSGGAGGGQGGPTLFGSSRFVTFNGASGGQPGALSTRVPAGGASFYGAGTTIVENAEGVQENPSNHSLIFFAPDIGGPGGPGTSSGSGANGTGGFPASGDSSQGA